jgi:hypothetical protein
MKPKFFFALVPLVLLVLGAVFLLKQRLGNVSTPAPASVESATSFPGASVAPSPAPISAKPAPANALAPEQQEAAIDAETDRLQQWSMNNDPASLSNILADLTNSEKEVREAAIEAAKEFGNSNAIPTLKSVAAKTADTEEQIALLQAADFLALPSISFDGSAAQRTPKQIQADEQRRVQRAARRQAQMQKSAGNPNPQSTPAQNSTTAPDNH